MEKWLIIFRQNLKVPTIVTERGKNVAKSLDIKLFLSQNINYFVIIISNSFWLHGWHVVQTYFNILNWYPLIKKCILNLWMPDFSCHAYSESPLVYSTSLWTISTYLLWYLIPIIQPLIKQWMLDFSCHVYLLTQP